MAIVSDVEIRLRADIARLQQDMTQARRAVGDAMGGITRAAEQAKLALFSIWAGSGVGGIGRMIDEYTKFTAQLKLASQSQREYAAGYADVKRIATQSTQGLQQTGVLYARIANGTRELGIAQKQVAAITETVNLSLLVSGATADEAASAQLQLSQAFAAGALRGEEFNAVNEAAPRLMLALADGIGVPIGALKKMAEEGQITSKIMADVLPNALVKLRAEAQEVQTIAGAFTVLKNEVMEFVGIQAQANGVVAGISGGLMALAQNLGLVAGAVAVITGARLVAWLSSVASGALSTVAANRALVVSNLEVARAEATATAQASALAGARLAEVRAATLAATGNVQLALATNGLIPAQTRAAATTVAHDLAMTKLVATQRAAARGTAALAAGTTALNGVLALTGGPIGLVITLLGAAALAWSHYGNKAKEAADKAKGETEKSTQEIVDGLSKQNSKLRERLELSKLIGKEAAQRGGEDVERLATLNQQINDKLRDINAGIDKDPNARLRVVELQYEYTGLANAMEQVAGTQKEIASGTRAQELSAWYAQNGSKTQKMGAELEELRKKFGSIPPEMEKLVRAKYAEKDMGADAIKQATKAAQDYIASLKEQAQTVGLTAEQQRMYTAAQAAAKAPTAALRLEIMEQAVATNEVVKANEAAAESQKAYQKMLDDSGKFDKEMASTRADAIKSATDEAESNERLAKTFGLTAAQVAQLELARLREQLASRASVGMTLDEIEHLEALIALKERSAAAVADVEVMEQTKQFWTDVEKTAHDTFMSIADGNKDMWQRMKETAKNTFFNWLYQMTVKKWIINISGQMSGTGGLGQAADVFSNSAGGNSSLGNLSSLYNAGKTIYSGFSSGFSSSMGGYVTQFGSAFGSTAATAFGTGMSTPGAAAVMGELASGAAGASSGTAAAGSAAAGASAGTYAIPIAGWIAAGMALSKGLYSQGWQAENGSMNGLGKFISSGSKGFDSILRDIGLSASTANMLSGMSTYVRLFGRKNPEITEQGVRGTAGLNGFSGEAYANILEKGGVFRSDKRYTKEAGLAAEQQEAFDTTLRNMAEAVRGFGGVLGAEVSNIEGYAKQINLVLTDDEAKNQQLIAEMFGEIGDELAVRMLPNIAQFQRSGESAAQTLERLSGEFQLVDGVLDLFGTSSVQALRAVGTASIEARTRLVALAGGVDALAQQTQFFADNFLTKAQQVAPLQRELADGLAALGYANLESKEDYAKAVAGLVESGALATEEGAKLYTELMKLGPAFKTVADYAEEVQAAARDAGRAQADMAMDELARAVDGQKTIMTAAYDAIMGRLNAGIEGVNATIERTGNLSRALKAAIGTVESPAQQAGMRAAAQAQITASLAIAKAGGALPTAEDLRDALAALGRDASGQFSTLADYQREVARTNNELLQMGGMADAQLSTAERQLLVLQEQAALTKAAYDIQTARLDSLVTNGQFMVSTLAASNNTLNDIHGVVNSLRLTTAHLGHEPGQTLGAEMLRQLEVPAPNYTAPSVTINSDAAILAALQSLESRMANVETNTQRAAAASMQFATQFDQVSAGGNALATETVN